MDHKPREPEGEHSLVFAELAVFNETHPPRNGIYRGHQTWKAEAEDAGSRS